uniref:Uncharacterized protein n=1 Tax=Setaria viridis TaxID=4556 RepID=A0A4V6DBA7_SETVI|nr:hypothetical protein SEVIR_2G195966v2 [Setaria viridis]
MTDIGNKTKTSTRRIHRRKAGPQCSDHVSKVLAVLTTRPIMYFGRSVLISPAPNNHFSGAPKKR